MARTLNSPNFTGTGPLPESTPFGSPFAPIMDATQKQLNFLIKVASERGINLIGIVVEETKTDSGEWVSKIGKRDASKMIDTYLSQPKVANPSTPAKPEITDGMYRNPETEQIFKVQKAVHGSGRLYAKELVQYADGWAFEYASGMVYKLKIEWKMTLDQAKAFGALYGTCCVCGRTLTDEKSIDAGIGPVCITKF